MTIELERPLQIETIELAFKNPRRMRISGTLATNAAQEQIERRLREVHAYILTANFTSFTVDVRELTFVNSSALRLFINWISRAERARYTLVFLTDPAVTWHRLNFAVLKSLAPGSVEIRGSEEAPG